MQRLLVAVVVAEFKLQSTAFAHPAGGACDSCPQPLGCDGGGECEGAVAVRVGGTVRCSRAIFNTIVILPPSPAAQLQPTLVVAASKLPSALPATNISQHAIGRPKTSFNKINKIKFCDPRQE